MADNIRATGVEQAADETVIEQGAGADERLPTLESTLADAPLRIEEPESDRYRIFLSPIPPPMDTAPDDAQPTRAP